MTYEYFVNKVSDCFLENSIDSLHKDCRFQETPDWDSMTLMSLVLLINAEFHMHLNAVDVMECDTLGQLFNLVVSKANE